MSRIRVEGLSKAFGAIRVLDDVSLDVPEGTFLTLLGPSGCGKTTLLRCVAGFVAPDAGQIFFDSRNMTAVDANKRNTALVFQNFALFPHLTVHENVAFGLRVRKRPVAERDRKVKEALALVSMTDLADRLPQHLSGGQQQRVALARAVVIRPDVLLLDEPLSALDAKLRVELQVQIREIQQRLGMTAIYVTHDQSEALRMSDSIAVINGGRVEQVAAPVELYRRPQTAFVANFIGHANLLAIDVTAVEGRSCTFTAAHGEQPMTAELYSDQAPALGNGSVLGVRPEAFALGATRPNRIGGKVAKITYSGSVWSLKVVLPTGDLIDAEISYVDRPPEIGNDIVLSWHPNDCFVLPNPGKV